MVLETFAFQSVWRIDFKRRFTTLVSHQIWMRVTELVLHVFFALTFLWGPVQSKRGEVSWLYVKRLDPDWTIWEGRYQSLSLQRGMAESPPQGYVRGRPQLVHVRTIHDKWANSVNLKQWLVPGAWLLLHVGYPLIHRLIIIFLLKLPFRGHTPFLTHPCVAWDTHFGTCQDWVSFSFWFHLCTFRILSRGEQEEQEEEVQRLLLSISGCHLYTIQWEGWSPAAAAESAFGLRRQQLHCLSDSYQHVLLPQYQTAETTWFGVEHEMLQTPFLEYNAPGLCLVGGLALGVDSWTPSLPGPYHTVAPSRSGHHKVSGIGMASQSATFLRNDQRKWYQFFDPAATNQYLKAISSHDATWYLDKIYKGFDPPSLKIQQCSGITATNWPQPTNF